MNNDDDRINEMVNKALERDEKINEGFMIKKRRLLQLKNDNEELSRIVIEKYDKDILKPIESFINRFNNKFPNGDIKISNENSFGTSVSSEIVLIGNNKINIKFKVVLLNSPHPINLDVIELHSKRPEIKREKIFGWGSFEVIDIKGFNFILVKSNRTNEYMWYILECTDNSRLRQTGKETFCLSLTKKEDQLDCYSNAVQEFSIDKFKDYIMKYNL